MLIINMSLSLNLYKRKQHIDVFFKPIFMVCFYFPKYSKAFWYIVFWILDEDLEADVSADKDTDCISDENLLILSFSYTATITICTLLVISLDLCIIFCEMCILQQTNE